MAQASVSDASWKPLWRFVLIMSMPEGLHPLTGLFLFILFSCFVLVLFCVFFYSQLQKIKTNSKRTREDIDYTFTKSWGTNENYQDNEGQVYQLRKEKDF